MSSSFKQPLCMKDTIVRYQIICVLTCIELLLLICCSEPSGEATPTLSNEYPCNPEAAAGRVGQSNDSLLIFMKSCWMSLWQFSGIGISDEKQCWCTIMCTNDPTIKCWDALRLYALGSDSGRLTLLKKQFVFWIGLLYKWPTHIKWCPNCYSLPKKCWSSETNWL